MDVAHLIEVVNKGKGNYNGINDHYVGRGSPLGNPYRVGKGYYTRPMALRMYRNWLPGQIARGHTGVCDELHTIARKLMESQQVRLVCYCKPLDCHGDIIKELICEKLAPLHQM